MDWRSCGESEAEMVSTSLEDRMRIELLMRERVEGPIESQRYKFETGEVLTWELTLTSDLPTVGSPCPPHQSPPLSSCQNAPYRFAAVVSIVIISYAAKHCQRRILTLGIDPHTTIHKTCRDGVDFLRLPLRCVLVP